MKISRALISVYDKVGVVEFARALSKMGVEILSTGGTAALLKGEGLPVIEVSDYTGSPEILDGRLKTLHPKIHGGLLAIRNDSKHRKQMDENQILPIDLLVVNLYPFEITVARPNCAFDEAIENIDIGGPAMIRAAAKNQKDVAVVVDPEDYNAIIEELDSGGGSLKPETRFRLAKKAFATTARYDSSIIGYLSALDDSGKKLDMPSTLGFVFEKVNELRYGENPHQKAAFYRDVNFGLGYGISNSVQLQGKELSYNNIMDADAVLSMTREFGDKPYAVVIVKHTNPCGAATSDISLFDAFAKAVACDPQSAFGGIVGINGVVDGDLARAVAETFFEVVVAPGYDSGALKIFEKKKNLRLLRTPRLIEDDRAGNFSLRGVAGGCLVQEPDSSREDMREAKVVTKRSPTENELEALDFAWRICKHVKSNAIVFAFRDRTLGIGAGQMSRVDSTRIAIMKAQASLVDSVLASDAFFPFRDGVDAAAEAGATAIVQPGGSVRDREVVEAADEHGIAMVFTGVRHFRH